MSMHHDATKADHADEDEERWIEAEIQRGLEALDGVDIDDDPSSGDKDVVQTESSSDTDDAQEQVCAVDLSSTIVVIKGVYMKKR